MPICTTCTVPIPHLYTVYDSAHNLRLEQCTACNQFADPYVEHDSLTLLLDLILLKRGVYLHLIYNRGSEPRRAGVTRTSVGDERPVKDRERSRWLLVLQLGGILVLVDAFIRWTHLKSSREHPLDTTDAPWTKDTMAAFVRTWIGCLVETVAFHSGIMLSCFAVSRLLDRFHRWSKNESGIRKESRFSMIPLALLYSSMSKLFLLFLLAIWRPAQEAKSTVRGSGGGVLDFLDDDKLDREWVVRNVLGGMSAGFGLRVIFDWHPGFTSMIIFVAWAIKTLVSRVVSGWVGGSEQAGQIWLAYSIP